MPKTPEEREFESAFKGEAGSPPDSFALPTEESDDATTQDPEPDPTPAADANDSDPAPSTDPDSGGSDDDGRDGAPGPDDGSDDNDGDGTTGGDSNDPDSDPAAHEPDDSDPEPDSDPKAANVLKELADVLKESRSSESKSKEPDPQPQEQPPELYSEEDKRELEGYEENWPDVSKAESLKRRAEYHDLTTFIFQEVARILTPMQGQLAALGNSMHMTELTTQVPDYSETLEQEVTDWISTQPSYLQAGMKQVMQNGTSDEVADLIGRYRENTGSVSKAEAKQPKPKPKPPTPKQTELSSAAKQAAESLAPVSGDRSEVPTSEEDVNDFESAFRKYAKAEAR